MGKKRAIPSGHIKLAPLKKGHRASLLRVYDSLSKSSQSMVLVGADLTRLIKVKPMSNKRRKALKSLIESEHQPITSKALIYTGRRHVSANVDNHEPLNDSRQVVTNAQSLSGGNKDILRILLMSGSSDED